nr:hypothetical protein GCM10020092_094000 [Actinoplanes digitatis]
MTFASARTEVSSKPSHRARRRRTQADRDGDRLLVVEQQGRHRRTRLQLISAGDAARRVDGIAQLPQPVDVAAERARADLEPLGQLGAGPVAVGLQEREQPQHPSTRVRHGFSLASIAV